MKKLCLFALLLVIIVGLTIPNHPHVNAQQDTIFDFDFNASGTLVAIASESKIYIADANTFALTRLLRNGMAGTVKWSPDNARLAESGRDGIVRIWNPNAGNLLGTIDHGSSITDIWWSPDSAFIYLSGVTESTVAIWNSNTYQFIRSIAQPGDKAALSPNGQYIAQVGGYLTVYRVSDNLKLFTGSDHTNTYQVAWSYDSTLIATTSLDGSTIIWDAVTGQNLHTLTVWGPLEWHPSKNILAIGQTNGLFLWDETTNQVTQVDSTDTTEFAWRPNGTEIIKSATDSTQINVVNVTQYVSTATPTFTPTTTYTPTFTPTPTATFTPTATATIPPTNLVGMYEPFEYANITPALQPTFVIKNNGAQSVPLNEIRLRYYFTREGTSPLLAYCSFVPYVPLGPGEFPGEAPEPVACDSSVIVETGAISPAVNGADSYVEMRFTAGTILPGAWAGRYILYIHKTDWSDFTQSSDYSFPVINPPFGLVTLGNWDKITLYRSTVRVWGGEPN